VKQVLLQRGRIVVEEVPAPLVDDGSVLVEVAHSLISVGTELAALEESKKSLVERALEQPEKILKLVAYFRQHGIQKSILHLQSRLDAGTPLGYSCAGTVLQVGKNVRDLVSGRAVACAGAGKAHHAEIVVVPRNLVVPVPEGCDLKDAASVTLGSIALQGVRRADPRLGEIVAVIGLGLLGQLTVQLLKTAGCRVVGVDVDPRRVALARELGAEHAFVSDEADPPAAVRHLSDGHGVDATLITAASTSDAIVQQAMELTRKKGRVVVVGAVGLGLKRSPFYEKEIDLLISCSYGPGRYDAAYEDKGVDYPYAYVRWTENRNMVEYLRLVAEGRINVKALIERECDVSQASEAYRELSGPERPLAVLLSYSREAEEKKATRVSLRPFVKSGKCRLAVIGAGSFAQGTHLPNLKRLNDRFQLRAVVSASGQRARAAGELFGADYVSTDYQEVLADPEVDAVLICTRHHLHARQAIAAARAGKAVFLEKPMALNRAELEELAAALEETGVPFMVGYNRRFSPFIAEIRRLTRDRLQPLYLHYRMNVGFIPADHWVHGEEGGGRFLGEACHIIDLFTSLTGSKVRTFSSHRLRAGNEALSPSDNLAVSLEYEDGSLAVLEYFTVGSSELPKEHLEAHWEGKSVLLEDYQRLTGYGVEPRSRTGARGDKGHLEELKVFAESLVPGAVAIPIPLWDLIQTAKVTLAISEKN
jgi:predicted dehydrogenase/NADPH:quinone reductase-like Zn-dependent oxidoreductase